MSQVKTHAYIGNLQTGAVFMCGAAKRMIKQGAGLHGGLLPVREFLQTSAESKCLDCLAQLKKDKLIK